MKTLEIEKKVIPSGMIIRRVIDLGKKSLRRILIPNHVERLPVKSKGRLKRRAPHAMAGLSFTVVVHTVHKFIIFLVYVHYTKIGWCILNFLNEL